MNILVTGASGKVGKYVARHLTGAGHSVTNLDRIPPPEEFSDIPWVQGDILDHAAMRELVTGYDAVAHLAGIPVPLFHPGEEVFRTNVMGTFNVVDAAAASRTGRLVFMSSESVLGFAFMERHIDPVFLPMDETHPYRPQEPYGMSKVAAESVCQSVARRTGMEVCILRSPWIWVPEPAEVAMYRQLVAEPEAWYRAWWAFCGVEDVASAFECALTKPLPVGGPDAEAPAPVYFAVADENWAGRDTLEIARVHYAVPPEAVRGLNGRQSAISNRKIRAELGWVPHQTACDFIADGPAEPATEAGRQR